MYAKEFLTVKIADGVIYLHARPNVELCFLGASCWVNTPPGTDRQKILVITPEKGKEALVAISVARHDCDAPNHRICASYFLPITWQEDKLVMDLGMEYFEGTNNYMLERSYIDHQGSVCIFVSKQWFASPRVPNLRWADFESARAALVQKDRRVVKDPGLLCRYMVEQATAEDLEFAATDDQRTADQRQLHKALEEIDLLKASRVELSKERTDLLTRLQTEKATTDELKQALEALNSKVKNLDDAVFNIGVGKTRFGNLPWVAMKKVRSIMFHFHRPQNPVNP